MTEQLTEPIDSIDGDLFSEAPPSWPKWIGGMAIAWGALMLTCTGIGAVMLPLQSKFMEPLLEGAPMPDGMKPNNIDWTLMGIGVVLTLLLLFGGIFCVTRNPISRIMILIWGVVSIPLSLFSYSNQMEKQASIRAWAEQYPDSPLAQNMNAGGATGQQIGEILGLVMTIVLGILIPAFFVIWFGLIKTKPEQMTGTEERFV